MSGSCDHLNTLIPLECVCTHKHTHATHHQGTIHLQFSHYLMMAISSEIMEDLGLLYLFIFDVRLFPYKLSYNRQNSSVQFISVAQSCPTLCDPMNRSTPGLPVHHQLPEFTQTHVHRVSDAIQPSHPLSSPALPAPNPSQHQGLFQ